MQVKINNYVIKFQAYYIIFTNITPKDRSNIAVAIVYMAKEFGWSSTTQGLVLSSFFVGYLTTQVLGGALADKFGGKWVLGAGE
jgi:MFS family permease